MGREFLTPQSNTFDFKYLLMSTQNAIIRNELKKLIKKSHKLYGPKLVQYYGKSEFYTIGQIKRIVVELNIRDEHIPFIYAYYLKQDDYDILSDEESIEYAYQYLKSMIEEVSQKLNNIEKIEILNIKESGIY